MYAGRYYSTKSRSQPNKCPNFTFLFVIILVFQVFVLLRFIGAVGIGVRIGVRVALRATALVVTVSAALPLSSWLINQSSFARFLSCLK